jgi:hypothetical protein
MTTSQLVKSAKSMSVTSNCSRTFCIFVLNMVREVNDRGWTKFWIPKNGQRHDIHGIALFWHFKKVQEFLHHRFIILMNAHDGDRSIAYVF